MRLGMGLLAALLASGCSAALLPEPAEDEVVLAPGVKLGGAVDISARVNRFGGISGLRGLPDGGLLMVSDRGRLYRATLGRGDAGSLQSVAIEALPQPDGLAGADVEALTQSGEEWLVSDEATGRLLHLPTGKDGLPSAAGYWGEVQPALQPRSFNAGVETLATLPDGRLLAIHEGEVEPGQHPAALGREGHWQAAFYATDPPFLPTDAVALPDGRLLVLERAVSLLRGFQCRVRAVPAAAIAEGRVMSGPLVAWFRAGLWAENCEGIHALPTADGGAEVLIISDNNHSPLQRTILMQLHLPSILSGIKP